MEYAVRIVNVHKHYQMGDEVVKALAGVSLDIPKGDFVAIMGQSGSGKSTLLNVLGTLDRPTSGSYVLAGQDVSKLPDDELAVKRNQSLGFIFQSYNLIQQYTVLENIELPLLYRKGYPPISAKDREWTLRLASQVGLGSRLQHRPTQLSGGQQQRVAIARALIMDPDVLLADEPTGNLDSATGEEIMQMLTKLNEEWRTIIMVTHENEVALRAKRQIYMKDGKIAGEGLYKG